MAITFRLLSPGRASASPITVNNRVYPQTPGQGVDVDAADAEILVVNDWVKVGQSGTTAARPTTTDQSVHGLSNPASRQFFDTTLGTLIFHDGFGWRDATGASV